ncbi:hypothetical protein [Berryella intestinalis]|nr:hypothetical protein [Berryella intestinalis]
MVINPRNIKPLEGVRSAGKTVASIAGNASESAGKLASSASKKAGEVGSKISDVANDAIEVASDGVTNVKKSIQEKRSMNFQNIESLQPVVNVVNEAAAALDDKNRTIRESAIPEVMGGALGAAVGGIGSFAALYGLGTVGLSAAGLTSGLATAGAIVGGGMAAGVFVLAAPVAVAAGTGVKIAANIKAKQLHQEKERLYKEALQKHQAIIQALKDESDANRERLDYLQSLNLLLERAVKDLRQDLDAS